MKKVLGILMISVFFIAGSASAELLERDLFTEGDGLLTYDSVTGMEWLDVVLTGGRSWSTWNSGADDWVAVYGFTWADQGYVSELFEHAGVEIINGPGNPLEWHFVENNLPGVNDLLQLLGVFTTLTNATGQYLYSMGYVQGLSELGGDYASAGISWNDGYFSTEPNGGWATLWSDASGVADWNTGAWLFRESEPVPEPATMFLLGSGLVGLVGFRRKIRK